MKLCDIQIRDPFVVVEKDGWYLFGSTDPDIWKGKATGFDAYRRTAGMPTDEWEGPFHVFRPEPGFWSDTNFWAPEVHRFQDAWYIFATFLPAPHPDGTRRRRGTAVLKSTGGLLGPYLPWSAGPVTPPDWECLDGTLFVEGGVPYLVFCHEWQQTGDGEVCIMPLSPDLRAAESGQPPTLLFRASDAPWTAELRGRPPGSYVTDGPFLYRLKTGLTNNGGCPLLMLWSSFNKEGSYCLGLARSNSGSVFGPWEQGERPFFQADGGHGMLFESGGTLYLTVHTPNKTPHERAIFIEVAETGGGLAVIR